ncbi:MAG: recombinase family protein [Clostridia bacterium]|nr:recombinase family protein [Clostridia bacterium]
MIYGYARCSTNEKKQDINRQIRELIQQGCTRETIYCEYQSGTKTDRVELNKLLRAVSEGDTIIATEISRLSRSTKQLCEIIDFVKDQKLKLVVGSFVVDCTTGTIDPMTAGMLQMMSVFAELERNMICERVRSGLENAKAKGKKIGRPAKTKDEVPAIFLKYYPQFADGDINVCELARLCGMSRTTVYKYIKIVEAN